MSLEKEQRSDMSQKHAGIGLRGSHPAQVTGVRTARSGGAPAPHMGLGGARQQKAPTTVQNVVNALQIIPLKGWEVCKGLVTSALTGCQKSVAVRG